MMIDPNFDRQARYLYNIEVKRIIDQFVKESESQLAKGLKDFTKAMNRDSTSVSKSMRELNRHVAKGAQKKIYEAYKASGIGRRESYREADRGKLKRYSKGAMDRALQSKAFFSYDSRQLSFINKTVLDRQAKQWYRLNFGAGPAGSGGRAPVRTNWRMGRKRIAVSLTLQNFESSANFRVPQSMRMSGAWSNQYLSKTPAFSRLKTGSGGALYLFPMQRRNLARKRPKPGQEGTTRQVLTPRRGTFRGKMSKGIRAHNFLEQGIDYINEEYPKQLYDLMDTWFRVGRDNMGRRRPFTWNPK